MNDQGLHPSADTAAADWLGPRLRRFGSAVTAVVPDGFPAYVRILHPARGAAEQPVRWAEVAAWSGRTMHRLVQFDALTRPAAAAPTGPAPWDGEPPPEGNLPAELLRILCATLAEHTSTAASCWFCLWDGYGWLHGSPAVAMMGRRGAIPVPPALPPEVLDGPRVRLPGRDYLLFAGPLAAAPELGWADPYGFFFPQSPNLFWPHDHAWCVASEIDLVCTLVAGSEALAQALVGDPTPRGMAGPTGRPHRVRQRPAQHLSGNPSAPGPPTGTVFRALDGLLVRPARPLTSGDGRPCDRGCPLSTA